MEKSHSLLAITAYINDANFHYTKCGMANLLQESRKQNSEGL